jgi:hypothetical protein
MLNSVEALQRLLNLGAQLGGNELTLGATTAAHSAFNVAALRWMQRSCREHVLEELCSRCMRSSVSADELRVLLEHPQTRATMLRLRMRCSDLTIGQHAGEISLRLLHQANLLRAPCSDSAAPSWKGDVFPLAWIAGRFERLAVCVETYRLRLHVFVVRQFAERGWLRLLQALLAAGDRRPADRAWVGEADAGAVRAAWLLVIRKAAVQRADDADDEMLRWACAYE